MTCSHDLPVIAYINLVKIANCNHIVDETDPMLVVHANLGSKYTVDMRKRIMVSVRALRALEKEIGYALYFL